MAREIFNCQLVDEKDCGRFGVQTSVGDLARHLTVDTAHFEKLGDGLWYWKSNGSKDDLPPEVLLEDDIGNFTISGRLVEVNFWKSRVNIRLERASAYRDPTVAIIGFDKQVRWDKKEIPHGVDFLYAACNKIVELFLAGKLRDFDLLARALKEQHLHIFDAIAQRT